MLVAMTAMYTDFNPLTFILHPDMLDKIAKDYRLVLVPHKGAWLVTVVSVQDEQGEDVVVN